MVRTSITSKGQTTVPYSLRRNWNTTQVVWEPCADGSARVRPAPKILDLFGSASGKLPKDPKEKQKARAALARI